MSQPLKILFVCTHNACRSVIGEVVTRALAEQRLEVASAGSNPAGRIHPLTLAYLEKFGYSQQGLRSKSFDDVKSFAPNIVITVCDSAANEPCPVWLSNNAISVHWGLPDPSHPIDPDVEADQAFLSTFATIEHRIRKLLAALNEEMEITQVCAILDSLSKEFC